MKFMNLILSATLLVGLSGCGIQSIPKNKNEVEASLSEVQNQYKRRLDLIPNLVSVVQGYAKHEKETFVAVTEARAKATAVTIDPSKMDAQKLKEYQAAQGSMSQALGRLMVVAEKYPDLKADTQFRDLQAQLEGTENRITVARNRYIGSIKDFNNEITVPPTSFTNSLFYHYEKMPQWDLAADEKGKAEKAPEVKF